MKLTLVNFHSEEEIELDAKDPVVIGRGSLFGCADKKVSRNHGQVQLTPDGNVHLIALHTNPCFFMKNGLPPVEQLTKDEEKILNTGDYIGLLPDSFWYKIVVKNFEFKSCLEIPLNSSNALRNESECSEKGTCGRVMNQIRIEDIKDDCEPGSNKPKEAEAVEEPSKPIDVCGKTNNLQSSGMWLTKRLKVLEKTKKLPLSMYEIDDFPGQTEQVNYQQNLPVDSGIELIKNEEFHIEENLKAVTSSDASLYGVNCATSSNNMYEKVPEVNRYDVEVKETDNNMVDAQCSKACVNELKKLEALDSDDETQNMDNKSTHSRKRPLCQYEEKCYRKNEEHQREFCHPGDEDFIPYVKRPKCQYGASCYRRNKTHLVEYQHPESTELKGDNQDSQKRKAQKNNGAVCERSEEDDYDLDDPFINDLSSDEYVPSDFDSSDDTLI